MTGPVRDNPERQRYELDLPGGPVFADYRRRGDTLLITHTETPPPLQGQGLAGRLVSGMIADARQRNLKILPLCRYVVDYFRRHPEDRDVLDEG